MQFDKKPKRTHVSRPKPKQRRHVPLVNSCVLSFIFHCRTFVFVIAGEAERIRQEAEENERAAARKPKQRKHLPFVNSCFLSFTVRCCSLSCGSSGGRMQFDKKPKKRNAPRPKPKQRKHVPLVNSCVLSFIAHCRTFVFAIAGDAECSSTKRRRDGMRRDRSRSRGDMCPW